jgi:FKBP-type peptidyl-prolyl cis-trans isomerase
MVRNRYLLLPVLAAALAISACGSSSNDDSSSKATSTPAAAATDPPEGTVTVSGPLGKKPTIKVTPDNPTPPADLVVKDLTVGKGPAAKKGDTVSVQYVGSLYHNNVVFDNSWDKGQPFSFPLGGGQVIPGWDKGVVGMKVGGRRELVIPPADGYGAQGSPPTIPANSTLVFVVDLEKITPAKK